MRAQPRTPPNSGEVLIRISAPHFTAGLVATNRRVTSTAPILHYMLGWEGRAVADYCDAKGWEWERLEVPP